jgi:hypothetical protein
MLVGCICRRLPFCHLQVCLEQQVVAQEALPESFILDITFSQPQLLSSPSETLVGRIGGLEEEFDSACQHIRERDIPSLAVNSFHGNILYNGEI